MTRDVLGRMAIVALTLQLGGGAAAAIEVRPRDGAAAPATTGDPPTISSRYGDGWLHSGPALDEGGAGSALAPSRIFAPATDGTYTGTVGGKPFTLTVAGNKITSWKAENLVCPSFTIVQSTINTSCNIAGNDGFTCGALGCSASGNMRISGAFSGNSVSGTFDADFQPPSLPCCQLRNLALTATRSGSGGPAAPSNLVATATSDDAVDLDWTDHANDETDFRVEARQGTSGSFTDIGSVAANASGAVVSGLDPATLYQFRVRAHNGSGYSAYSNTASATTLGGPAGPCVADDTTLCLSAGRFEVRATYRTAQPQSGQAHAVGLTADTGYLWFFGASNVEAVIKVINACTLNNRYWVFAGGLTDVEVILTVTDTHTGAVKAYTNPLGTKFTPLQDTSAFATCP
jgi:hypothetical protein